MTLSRRARWTTRLLPWLLLPVAGAALVALELRLKRLYPDPGLAAPQLVWVFSPAEPGAIISTALLAGDRVYASVVRDRGLSPAGALVALDDADGRPAWWFDGDGAMLHMYSSPRLADGRLYVGDGMHANFDTRLWCADAASGRLLWSFPAGGHIESTPLIEHGRVYFGAGDDGVYALDAVSGEKLWQFNESLHIDSSPALADGKVYVGSGASRRFQAAQALALDARTGQPVWRVPVDLPAWGSPVVDGADVFFGLGNGRLNRSDPMPAGAVICLDAASGRRIWEGALPDGVLARVAVDADTVYAGCRDGHVYALARSDGRRRWKRQLDSPVVTTPALAGGSLIVAASAGMVVALRPETGEILARFDIAEHAQMECRVYSSPAVRVESDGGRRVYVGAELRLPGNSLAALYCLRF